MSWSRRDRGATEHQDVKDRLSAYLDGELSPREMSTVKQHLATCQDCQCCLDTLQQTVQWTRGLPPVPVPRAFVIPAMAQPARALQPRRSLLPVLQGATALVALLLVFAVAGDALLTGFMPAGAPAPAALKEPAPQVVEVTREVESVVEAPAAEAERSAVTEAAVAEATAAPAPAEPLPAEKAMAAEAPPTEEAEPSGMGVPPTAETQVSAMTAPPGMGGGEEAVEMQAAPAPEISAAEAITMAAEAMIVATDVATESVAAGPAPASEEPTPEPLAVEAPSAVAAAPAPGEAMQAERGERDAGLLSRQPPLANWLRLAELVFGLAFIVLGVLTIAAMIRRRRTR